MDRFPVRFNHGCDYFRSYWTETNKIDETHGLLGTAERSMCVPGTLSISLAGHRPGNGGRTGIVYVYGRRIGWRFGDIGCVSPTKSPIHLLWCLFLFPSLFKQLINKGWSSRLAVIDQRTGYASARWGVQLTAGHKKLRVTVQRTKERVGMKSQRSNGCMFSYKWGTPSLFPPLGFCFSSAQGAMSSVSLRRLIGIVRLDWKSHFAWLLSDPSPSSSLPYKYIYLRDAITTNIA
jgi:hypothetical protein